MTLFRPQLLYIFKILQLFLCCKRVVQEVTCNKIVWYRRVNQPLQNPVSPTLKSRHLRCIPNLPSPKCSPVFCNQTHVDHVHNSNVLSTRVRTALSNKKFKDKGNFQFGWLSHIQLNTPLPIIQNTCNSSTAGKATCSAETAGGAQS